MQPIRVYDGAGLPITSSGSALSVDIANKVGTDYTRAASVLHRSAIAAADKLILPTLATTATASTGGSLPQSTTYKLAVAPGTAQGSAGVSNIVSQATGAGAPTTHCITLTIPQVVNATYYDIFFSVDAAPLWVGRVTETQRATGGFQIQTYGVVTASGGNAADTVKIGVVGTGIATGTTIFTVNNGYVLAGITPVTTTGYEYVVWHVTFALTDLRAAPTLIIARFQEDDQGVAYCTGTSTLVYGGAIGEPMYQIVAESVKGAAKAYCLVDAMAGNGTVTIRAERV